MNVIKRKILVVDDEKFIIEFLQKALTSQQVDVAGASDGEEAIAYIKKNEVDLVITDIMMPKMTGDKLFFEVKKIDPFIQVIIITGYPTLQNIVQMMEGGANDFLIKPFKIEQLKSIVFSTFDRIDRWRALKNEWQIKRNV